MEQNSNLVQGILQKFKNAFPSYSQNRVRNAETILRYAVGFTQDENQLAYILATAVGESGMEPVKEKRLPQTHRYYASQARYYDKGYYGRGYVQITLIDNYKKFSKILGIDLVTNPDLALDPQIACEILVIGMVEGLFTKYGELQNFINSSEIDFFNARKIINPGASKDDYQKIADLAHKIIKS